MCKSYDLGANYFGDYTVFKVWSPAASRLKTVIYNDYFDSNGAVYDMYKGQGDIWELKLEGNYKNKYYNYLVTIGNIEKETPDPYAKAATINGSRGMIVDLESLNPRGWDNHSITIPIKSTEAVIYEIHVRDFSVDINSGMKYKGKYLAFTEENTSNESGVSTGIAHLKDLGITHIHFLPIFDFDSVDERLSKDYNWGYDPFLYHVPEGSYSTNPYDGAVRILELKQMIQSLHENNIGIIMDVVFNHTSSTDNSPFDVLAPRYYYRTYNDGSYANGSGCGNEIASEKQMARKFIIDCVKFWAKEYKIDGFRFDLMALIDIETMLEIKHQLSMINPNILIYGEPWTGGSSALPYEMQFKKGCQRGTGISVFNDDFRNAIKGDNDGSGLGFISGVHGMEHEIKKGIAGSIHYNDYIYGLAQEPDESINYVSSHDNLTLFDKLKKSCSDLNEFELEKIYRLALAIILTSQGIAFLHGGSEILRSKLGDSNSYRSGDKINQIDWSNKSRHLETFNYIKGLISIRKSQKVMTMGNAADIIKNLVFTEAPQNAVAYLLSSTYVGDFRHILVIHNANRHEIMVNNPLPGYWRVIANGEKADLRGIGCDDIYESSIRISPLSTFVLVQ